ncbi:hypothetical protein [Gorillibacterium massiliense]|uniref:hypothetical protein n=1 Tax=Gorillibacterium massiliense TaxID=1280390 RepID=UPI0004B01874|nr:hypothetical protein [Gorillibacterium massiliense]
MDIHVIVPIPEEIQALPHVLEMLHSQKEAPAFHTILVGNCERAELHSMMVHQQDHNPEFSAKWLHVPTANPAKLRNAAVSACEGGLLIFNEGNRIPGSDFVQEHVIFHQQSGNMENLLVMGTPQELDTALWKKAVAPGSAFFRDQEEMRVSLFIRKLMQLYNREGMTDSFIPWISTFGGNMSGSHELFRRHGFDEQLGEWGLENIDFGYRLFQDAGVFKWNRKAFNYAFEDKKETGYYENRILRGSYLLEIKFRNSKAMQVVGPFLLGELTLEAIEYQIGNTRAKWLLTREAHS